MKKPVKILWLTFSFGLCLIVLLILCANFGTFGKMPSIEELQNPSASLASQIYADDGTLMGKYFLQDRVNVKYSDISKYAVEALVATEDERFYKHSGIDLRALIRAISSFGNKGGASTITMQTAKNLFTEHPSNNPLARIIQKIKECIIAIKLERNFTKDEIITLYLNTVPFSDNVFGIRNAAKTFFQKEPDHINIEEAAVLIGMVNAPSLYNPRTYPANALSKRNTVIDQMVRNNYLTATEASSIKQKTIKLNYKKVDETAGIAPYFKMVLGEEMKKWCKQHKKGNGDNYNVYKDGLKIYTTINPEMQAYAEQAVSKHMKYMQKLFNTQSNIKSKSVWKGRENVLEAAMKISDRWNNMKKNGAEEDKIRKSFNVKTKMKVFAWNSRHETDTTMTPLDSIKYCHQMLQAGFMAMDPLNGEVKAWVGGIDFKTFKYDHVNINTKRQVGSTIKPLLYSLAIEEAGFTPNTMVVDEQQSFGGFGLVPATSATCTGRTMSMSSALTWSRNCATAYIMKQIGAGNEGAKRFADFLKNCNVQSKIPLYPSIALGSAEISLFEMMQAYSMFPGRGFNVKPMYIIRIEDKNGNIIQTNIPQRKEVISELTAYEVISMMEDVLRVGTGRRIWGYGVSGEIAGKTGTTNDNSDAWFIGYSPQLLCGVWTGCDDRFIRFNSTALGQGSAAALPIWAYFYKNVSSDKKLAYATTSEFVKPDVGANEVAYDWVNHIHLNLGAQGEDQGNGNAGDYGEENYYEPDENAPAENDTAFQKLDDTKPFNNDQNTNNKRENNQSSPKPPANTEKRPKAVMPKKENESTEDQYNK